MNQKSLSANTTKKASSNKTRKNTGEVELVVGSNRKRHTIQSNDRDTKELELYIQEQLMSNPELVMDSELTPKFIQFLFKCASGTSLKTNQDE